MKNKILIFGVIALIIVLSILNTIFSTPSISKDENFSKVFEAVYQNSAYNFSITFPNDWEITSAGVDDSQAIVQKATKGNAIISVAIRKPSIVLGELSPENMTIKDIMEFEVFKNQTEASLEKAIPDITNLEFGETSIDHHPAYWVKFRGSSSENDGAEETIKQYQLFSKNVLYMISTTAYTEDFAKLEEIFNNTVNSFQVTK